MTTTIPGVSRAEIIKHLYRRDPDEYQILMANYSKRRSLTGEQRAAGQTTGVLIDALKDLADGHKVAILGNTRASTDSLSKTFRRMAKLLEFNTKHIIAMPYSIEEWEQQDVTPETHVFKDADL